MTKSHYSRDLLFLCFSIITVLAFYGPLTTLFVRSFHDEINDYILLVPLVSGYFFYLKREQLHIVSEYAVPAGIGVIAIGCFLYLIGINQEGQLNQNDYLSMTILSFIITWMGGFVLFYGMSALKSMLFPFLFLFLMVPLPTVVMEWAIEFLQESSADVTYALFQLVGMPVMREGFVFHLPHLSIEVAKQCSGIHSAIALMITSIIAAKLFLSTGWRKSILMLSVIPLTILKNGMRIVTLSLLGNNLDERILSSPLHRKGGIPFFFLAVAELLLILWFLKRSEAPSNRPVSQSRSLSSSHSNP